MDETYARDGTPRKIQQIRSIKIGDSKQQLFRLAGQPVSASQDGAWNFNLRLTLEQRNQLVCQFKVYFDENERVSGTLWRRPQCADIITGKRK
ncbi:outer membrane protein assembly factor BamE [Rhodobacteraceae bacterium KMM 6894]|nr:outer membrane protein assembly factor BamE [Rhodobacteraceae bacterium KMM 6894]